MNIFEFKRKALGHVLCAEGDGIGADFSGFGWNGGSNNSVAVDLATPDVSQNQTQTQTQTQTQNQTQDQNTVAAGMLDGMDPADVAAGLIPGINYDIGGQTTAAAVAAELGLSPEQFNNYAGLPGWYNMDNPGLRESWFNFTNPARDSTAYGLGLRGIGMTYGDLANQETAEPGLNTRRMDTLDTVVFNPIAQAIKAATPLGTMEQAAKAFNSAVDGNYSDAGTFASNLVGGLVGSKLAGMLGLQALSPAITSTIRGGLSSAVGGGDVASGAVNGLATGLGSMANSLGASALGKGLGISPAAANGLSNATGLAGTVQNGVGALTRSIAGQ